MIKEDYLLKSKFIKNYSYSFENDNEFESILKDENTEPWLKEVCSKFFVKYNISFLKYELNNEYFKNKHLYFSDANWEHIAPSLIKIIKEFGPPPIGYPEWFLLGFPDVVYWASYSDGLQVIIKALRSYDESELRNNKNSQLSLKALSIIIEYFQKNQPVFECEKPLKSIKVNPTFPLKKQPEFINSDNIPDASAVHKKPVKKTESVNKKSIGLELFMFFFVAACIFGFLFFKEIKGFFQQTFIGETLKTAETTDPIDPLQSFNWIGSPGKQTHFRNGDAIIEVWSKPEWDSLCRSKVPAFCHVENNRDNDEMYGLLYNWWAISDPRNICPEGYHLPTKEDLLSLDSNTLFNQNRSELLTHFPGYKNENGYFKGKEELLTVWFNQSRYTGCYEACIVSNDNMKFDCYAANNAYSILFIPD